MLMITRRAGETFEQPLPDDDPAALEMLCDILHYKFNANARVTIADLFGLACVADKYKCAESVGLVATKLCEPHVETAMKWEGQNHGGMHFALLRVAYLFDNAALFQELTRDLAFHVSPALIDPEYTDATRAIQTFALMRDELGTHADCFDLVPIPFIVERLHAQLSAADGALRSSMNAFVSTCLTGPQNGGKTSKMEIGTPRPTSVFGGMPVSVNERMGTDYVVVDSSDCPVYALKMTSIVRRHHKIAAMPLGSFSSLDRMMGKVEAYVQSARIEVDVRLSSERKDPFSFERYGVSRHDCEQCDGCDTRGLVIKTRSNVDKIVQGLCLDCIKARHTGPARDACRIKH